MTATATSSGNGQVPIAELRAVSRTYFKPDGSVLVEALRDVDMKLPGGQYIAHAGHDPYIYVYRLADILAHANDAIPVAHKVWAGDHAEYIDFNADGSFLSSAHQNGLIKLWVWMGEDPAINARRHEWVRSQQRDAGN